uniref:Uncharacterized protein n=1 Tax=Romanomermis culicivorax TaxID=13658 RepID=A0A915IWZ9_ROMCU
MHKRSQSCLDFKFDVSKLAKFHPPKQCPPNDNNDDDGFSATMDSKSTWITRRKPFSLAFFISLAWTMKC